MPTGINGFIPFADADTAREAGDLFADLRVVIIDELHALAASKRGPLLAGSCEVFCPIRGRLAGIVRRLRRQAEFGFERGYVRVLFFDASVEPVNLGQQRVDQLVLRGVVEQT